MSGRKCGAKMQLRNKRLTAAAAIAAAIAIPAEGLRQVAYTDVQPGKVYSLTECRARLDHDMQAAVEMVERCAPGLGENQLAAFADAVYNIGPKVACDTKNSTAARLLRSGQIGAACAQLPRWNKARVAGVMVELPGLTKRRQVEYVLCMRGLT